ncbi:hypothetical protein [Limosilactobacillus mucosae]|nr:hypothetical protein [Limosilactobacillus mucosae]SDN12129.1 hypothetical protein SAMN05216430_10352 [Limosilactobacillus mucosae]SEK61269.1 hypothetical protein SAMN05216545_103185 [Limosilactobacillus mucosae]SFK01727.1 hypothetical protein SAMN05216461_103198 [Limosilactobacillus mucosae]
MSTRRAKRHQLIVQESNLRRAIKKRYGLKVNVKIRLKGMGTIK